MFVTISKQRGMSMISVIFLLVILSGMGAYLIRMTAIQQIASALEMQELRAYALAESGLQYMKHAPVEKIQQCLSGSINETLDRDDGFAGFTLNIKCQDYGDYPYADAGAHLIKVHVSAAYTPTDRRFEARRTISAKIARVI